MNQDFLPDFNKHLQSLSKRNLTNVQKIVEFYFWIAKLDRKYEPFERHVRAAKKINDWALEKAYSLIAELKSYFEERGLSYNLDTIYRNIPKYKAIREESEEDKKRREDLEYEEKRSKEQHEEFLQFQREQEERDRRKKRSKQQ
ncbi:MAG: hypothetical protein Q8P75_00450 [bacterium]|nr:hypothetical protein [bacterium]